MGADSKCFEEEGEEVAAIQLLEKLAAAASFTVKNLEDAYAKCKDMPIPLVFLADILFRATKMDLQELSYSAQDLLDEFIDRKEQEEEDEEGVVKMEHEELQGEPSSSSFVDVEVCRLLAWMAHDDDGVDASKAIAVLKPFVSMVHSLSLAYANPCGPEQIGGPGAILTWHELQLVAVGFMAVRNPGIFDALPVIKILRRKPILSCRGLTPHESEELALFDRKWDHICNVLPVIEVLADPVCVLVESVQGGPPPPQVAAILAAINGATVNPMPSGVSPVNMGDIGGGTFSNLFSVQTVEDGRTFAAMLRCELADALGAGGPGQGIRIATFRAPAAAFRLY